MESYAPLKVRNLRKRKFLIFFYAFFSLNTARFTDRRRKFRVSTVQVPKQGLNLHRESAFYVALVVQVPALKWNLRHLWLNLHHLRLNLHHIRLNLRHRGASVHFRNSPADVRTKKRHSSAVAMYVHPSNQP